MKSKFNKTNSNFCLILAHPDLSAYRVVLFWLWIKDHNWNKEHDRSVDEPNQGSVSQT
jgi:hypothetical protein